MSSNVNKPLKESQQWTDVTPLNLWGPVRYPKNISSQISHQDWHEKCFVVFFIAILLTSFSIMACIICRGRRQHYQLYRGEPRHRVCLRGYKSKAVTFVESISSMTIFKNTKDEQANMERICAAEPYFQPSIVITDENPMHKIEKPQPENIFTKTEPVEVKKCFGMNIVECISEGCKGKFTKFQDLTIRMFEHQHDAIVSV